MAGGVRQHHAGPRGGQQVIRGGVMLGAQQQPGDIMIT
jgi:hypothetical protein